MVCIAVTFFSRNESLHFEIINLQHIYSIRYTEKSAVVDEEDPEDSGWICKKVKIRFVQFYCTLS